MTHAVFVYGTLKRGQPNHHIITDSKEGKYTFVGEGRTASKYPLVIATAYNIPFVLDAEGEGHHVVGEVYEVDDVLFRELDELEGYPGFYDRRKVSIRLESLARGIESQDVRECWLYFLPKYKPSLRDLDLHENYDSNGAHGKPYVTSEELDCVEDI